MEGAPSACWHVLQPYKVRALTPAPSTGTSQWSRDVAPLGQPGPRWVLVLAGACYWHGVGGYV